MITSDEDTIQIQEYTQSFMKKLNSFKFLIVGDNFDAVENKYTTVNLYSEDYNIEQSQQEFNIRVLMIKKLLSQDG